MGRDKNWTRERLEKQIRIKLKEQKQKKDDTKKRN